MPCFGVHDLRLQEPAPPPPPIARGRLLFFSDSLGQPYLRAQRRLLKRAHSPPPEPPTSGGKALLCAKPHEASGSRPEPPRGTRVRSATADAAAPDDFPSAARCPRRLGRRPPGRPDGPRARRYGHNAASLGWPCRHGQRHRAHLRRLQSRHGLERLGGLRCLAPPRRRPLLCHLRDVPAAGRTL